MATADAFIAAPVYRCAAAIVSYRIEYAHLRSIVCANGGGGVGGGRDNIKRHVGAAYNAAETGALWCRC